MQYIIRLLIILLHLLTIALLTILTQVGGIIYLLCFPLYSQIKKRFSSKLTRFLLQVTIFLLAYTFIVLVILPPCAAIGGRVAMPVADRDIKPHNRLTVLLCRHYVRPELRRLSIAVAADMARRYPGTVLLYLDAQHPFFNGWPLLPHLSHSDGRKLDVALLWKERRNDKLVFGTPSPIGYGVFEDPGPNEYNRAAECEQKGYWQYSYMETIVPQDQKPYFRLDEERTATMTRLFCAHPRVKRVLIEPYLKKRLHLEDLNNLRYAGCQAVRHDDHIHVELGY